MAVDDDGVGSVNDDFEDDDAAPPGGHVRPAAGMRYVIRDRIAGSLDCNLLVVTSQHVTLCMDRRLQAYASSTGELQKEWVLEAPIRYIKVAGGLPGREGLLVGLKGGAVYHVLLDNPIPLLVVRCGKIVYLGVSCEVCPRCSAIPQSTQHISCLFLCILCCVCRHSSSIRCLDLSLSRRKLAVVDETSSVVVYSLPPPHAAAYGLLAQQHLSAAKRSTPDNDSGLLSPPTGGEAADFSQPQQQQQHEQVVPAGLLPHVLFSESGANSVAWNAEHEDMLCFSGGSSLSIKTGHFPPHKQKMAGFVVGFVGSKVFCLHATAMQTVDVPLSDALRRYVASRTWDDAYRIACLGVTESDWRLLGEAALRTLPLQLSIARAVYGRLQDVRKLDLVARLERQAATPSLFPNPTAMALTLLGDVTAHSGDYVSAVQLYVKAGQIRRALDLLTDLRLWDQARELVSEYAEATAAAGGGGATNEGALTTSSVEARAQPQPKHQQQKELSLTPAEANEHVRVLMLKQAAVNEAEGGVREAAILFNSAGQPAKAIAVLLSAGDGHSLRELIAALSVPAVTGLQASASSARAGGDATHGAALVSNYSSPESLISALASAASFFRQQGDVTSAKEAMLRMGQAGAAELVALFCESGNWDAAEALAGKADAEARARGDLVTSALVHSNVMIGGTGPSPTGTAAAAAQGTPSQRGRVQYQRALWLAGQASAAVTQGRYKDASVAYMQCGLTSLSLAHSGAGPGPGCLSQPAVDELCKLYASCRFLANVHAAYGVVASFIASPAASAAASSGGAALNASDATTLFHASRFILNRVVGNSEGGGANTGASAKQAGDRNPPPGISLALTLFALAKASVALACNKTARFALSALQALLLPPALRTEADRLQLLTSLRPLRDAEEVVPVCFRCGVVNAATTASVASIRAAACVDGPYSNAVTAGSAKLALSENALISQLQQSLPMQQPPPVGGDACSFCGQAAIRSYLTFEQLPLVEFRPDPSIPQTEALQLIQTHPKAMGGDVSGGGGSRPGTAAVSSASGGGTSSSFQSSGSSRSVTGADTLTLSGAHDSSGTLLASDVFLQYLSASNSGSHPAASAAHSASSTKQQQLPPVTLPAPALLSLPPSDVFIIWPGADAARAGGKEPLLPPRLFKLVIPDVPLSMCRSCNHFAHKVSSLGGSFDLNVLARHWIRLRSTNINTLQVIPLQFFRPQSDLELVAQAEGPLLCLFCGHQTML